MKIEDTVIYINTQERIGDHIVLKIRIADRYTDETMVEDVRTIIYTKSIKKSIKQIVDEYFIEF